MEFDGVGQEQYDGVIRDLALGGKTGSGGVVEAAGPVEGGWRVVDVWESAAAFDPSSGRSSAQQCSAPGSLHRS